MNNDINQNQMQDMNMQPMNVNGQPVELNPTPDNMVNMDQVMGTSSSALADVADPAGNQKLKKAGIYLGIIGLLLVIMGIVYNALGIGTGEETPTNTTPNTEEVADEQSGGDTGANTEATETPEATEQSGTENRVAAKSAPSLTCKLNNKSTTNGINQVLTYEFYTNNDKLYAYDKTYEVIPITGHSNGIVSVNKEVNKYDGLKAKIENIPGYIMSVSSVNNGKIETLTVRMNIDLSAYKNNLPNELKKNKVTNVEYNSNSDINAIKKELTKSGYSC